MKLVGLWMLLAPILGLTMFALYKLFSTMTTRERDKVVSLFILGAIWLGIALFFLFMEK